MIIRYMHIGIKRIFIILGLLVTLVGCSRGNSPVCVLADDFGDIVKRDFTLSAAGTTAAAGGSVVAPGWYDTGIDVEVQRSLQINTQGTIELCPRVVRTVDITVPANSSGWLPTNIIINRGLNWEIVNVTGGYSTNCTISVPNNPNSGGTNTPPDYGSAQCAGYGSTAGQTTNVTFTQANGAATTVPSPANFTNGRGLYAYVGDAPDESWYGTTVASNSTDNEHFFNELVRTNSNASSSVYSESNFSYQGRLYFRMKDVPSLAQSWDSATAYDNNVGNYVVRVSYVRKCEGVRGQFLQASIGQSPGISGTTRDLSAYAYGLDGEEPGVFNGHAWASGRLWLRILDDASKLDWIGFEGISMGDDDYTPRPSDGRVTEGSNWGKYYVNVVTTRQVSDSFSNAITSIVDPVKDLFWGDPTSTDPSDFGLTKRMYISLTQDINFIDGVRAAVALSIVFFAISYMLGLTQVKGGDAIVYLIKISLVLVLISDQSWTFFYDNLYSAYIYGMDELIWMMSGQFADSLQVDDPFPMLNQLFVASTDSQYASITDGIDIVLNGQSGVIHGDEAQEIARWFIPQTNTGYDTALQSGGMAVQLDGVDGVLYNPNTVRVDYDGSVERDVFSSLNQTLARFFSTEANIKISALFFAFPFGWMFGIGVYIGMFFFLIGLVRAVLMYLLAIIMVSLMLFLAPIFFVFLLFPLLKGMFDSYLRVLAGFVMQPVFMFAVLSLFNIFIVSIFYVLLHYNACWGCVISFDFPFNDWLGVSDNFDKFCIADAYKPWGSSPSQPLEARINSIPINIFTLFMFLILTSTFNAFLDWATVTSVQLSSGSAGVQISGAARGMIGGAVKTAASAATAGYAVSGAKLAKDRVSGAWDKRKKRKEAKKKENESKDKDKS